VLAAASFALAQTAVTTAATAQAAAAAAEQATGAAARAASAAMSPSTTDEAQALANAAATVAEAATATAATTAAAAEDAAAAAEAAATATTAGVPEHATVPLSARVLLADDPAAWPGRPRDPHLFQLWTRLRVAVLGAIWRVRCQRSEQRQPTSFARCAVSLALETLVGAIQRDWLRTQQDVRTLDDGFFCQSWWRGFDTRLSVDDFARQWAPLFCRVLGDVPAAGDPDTRSMVLCLDGEGPVPLPD
jgi:hypothetical protein